MQRSYLSIDAQAFSLTEGDAVLGVLATHLPFALEPIQRDAWAFEVDHLRSVAAALGEGTFFLEFMIPRMGRRADVVLIYRGIVFVIEYKVNATGFDRAALEQAYGYGLDLKHFHETSHDRRIVPIVVATAAGPVAFSESNWDSDRLCKPLRSDPASLSKLVSHLAQVYPEPPLDPTVWSQGRYKPTPTIIEAAQALYRGHDVDEISRSEAGAENLTATASYIAGAIEECKTRGEKAICFVTGVPGSGKTLAGLNIANLRMRAHDDEHAVFLSGNGPLVAVLRTALANDACDQAVAAGRRPNRGEEQKKADAFIQNIHHFRDEALTHTGAPVEKVVVFDEAQRAWGEEQTSKFMREKRGQAGFSMSEPEFLLSVMDRHQDWCAIICLVGEGQEINTGEAGITEWLRALARSFPHWRVHLSEQLRSDASTMASGYENAPALHLATSIRSFRAEKLSEFVRAILDDEPDDARRIISDLREYPIYLTRDLNDARRWLRSKRRGPERAGVLASSNGLRLKPHGIFVKAKADPATWFLAPPEDVRSSDCLEDAATEFEVQGLEVDWACVCWDANLRRSADGWKAMSFRGTAWQEVRDPQRVSYIINAYRVLLTRARQGMIVFVPLGDSDDSTRQSAFYDPVFEYFKACGILEIRTQ